MTLDETIAACLAFVRAGGHEGDEGPGAEATFAHAHAHLFAMRAAMAELWKINKCYRVQDAAIYCGICDGENAPEGSSWFEAPHDAGCPFHIANRSDDAARPVEND